MRQPFERCLGHPQRGRPSTPVAMAYDRPYAAVESTTSTAPPAPVVPINAAVAAEINAHSALPEPRTGRPPTPQEISAALNSRLARAISPSAFARPAPSAYAPPEREPASIPPAEIASAAAAPVPVAMTRGAPNVVVHNVLPQSHAFQRGVQPPQQPPSPRNQGQPRAHVASGTLPQHRQVAPMQTAAQQANARAHQAARVELQRAESQQARIRAQQQQQQMHRAQQMQVAQAQARARLQQHVQAQARVEQHRAQPRVLQPQVQRLQLDAQQQHAYGQQPSAAPLHAPPRQQASSLAGAASYSYSRPSAHRPIVDLTNLAQNQARSQPPTQQNEGQQAAVPAASTGGHANGNSGGNAEVADQQPWITTLSTKGTRPILPQGAAPASQRAPSEEMKKEALEFKTKVEALAKALSALWEHPPPTVTSQVDTMMLHRLRAILAIDQNLTRAKVSTLCQVSPNSLSLYLRGLLRGDKTQEVLETNLSKWILESYYHPDAVAQRKQKRDAEWMTTVGRSAAPLRTRMPNATNANHLSSPSASNRPAVQIASAPMQRQQLAVRHNMPRTHVPVHRQSHPQIICSAYHPSQLLAPHPNAVAVAVHRQAPRVQHPVAPPPPSTATRRELVAVPGGQPVNVPRNTASFARPGPAPRPATSVGVVPAVKTSYSKNWTWDNFNVNQRGSSQRGAHPTAQAAAAAAPIAPAHANNGISAQLATFPPPVHPAPATYVAAGPSHAYGHAIAPAPTSNAVTIAPRSQPVASRTKQNPASKKAQMLNSDITYYQKKGLLHVDVDGVPYAKKFGKPPTTYRPSKRRRRHSAPAPKPKKPDFERPLPPVTFRKPNSRYSFRRLVSAAPQPRTAPLGKQRNSLDAAVAEFADQVNDDAAPAPTDTGAPAAVTEAPAEGSADQVNPPVVTPAPPATDADNAAPSATDDDAATLPVKTTASFVRPAQVAAAAAPAPLAVPELSTEADCDADADKSNALATAVMVPDVELDADLNPSAPSAEEAGATDAPAETLATPAVPAESLVTAAPPAAETRDAPDACTPSSEDAKAAEIEAAPASAVTEVAVAAALAADKDRGTKRGLEEVYHEALDGSGGMPPPSKAARSE